MPNSAHSGPPRPRPAGRDSPAVLLTAQQFLIARMAAEGATNREIAVRLALSHRTIDHHLRGVFNRLGIRSRIELVRLIAQADAQGTGRPGHRGTGASRTTSARRIREAHRWRRPPRPCPRRRGRGPRHTREPARRTGP